MTRRSLVSAAVLTVVALVAKDAAAEDCAVLTRANVVACALRDSPAIRADREAVAGAEGRRLAARPWFPAPATLALSAARRVGVGGASAFNYYATLSQEVEISGQRSSRRRSAEAEVSARGHDAIATARRVAADAYVAWFEVLAARDAVAAANLLETTSLQIARVAQARAEAGVGSPLDAEVADAASLRIVQGRLSAERAAALAAAELATLLGRDPTRDVPVAKGELEPLAGSDGLSESTTSRVVANRPEVRSLLADERAAALRAEAFRRARIPSLTFQVFAQNDGFDERVLGGGLALPLPLPEPVGRRFAGDIAQSEALARERAARAEASTRALSNELARALADYRSRKAELALYSRERVSRAELLLGEIGKEIESGRLPVRDALVAQQQLIEVLRGYVEARRALCLSSVDLALAAGVPLEGSAR